MIDALGHLGYVALLGGQLAISRRYAWGWALRVVGSLLWAGLGVAVGLTSIWIWSLAFVAVDLRGWLMWRRR